MDYLISGIPNSDVGVGRVISHLENVMKKQKIISPQSRKEISLKKLLTEKKFFLFLKEIIMRKYSRFYFISRLNKLRNKKLILIHPQTIGLKETMKLISKNNVTLYIMDNSFFCRSSYNYMDGEMNSCTRCLGGNYKKASQSNCSHPMIKNSEEYIKFYKFLIKNSNKLNFYSQNNQQTQLLKLHFGDKVNVEEIGLLTRDMFEKSDKIKLNKKINQNYDVVYHGANVLAKGVGYTVELARVTPNLKYLIPNKKSEVEKIIGEKIDIQNILFKEMSWESGLGEAVRNSKIILCPSIWSAPIEGAVVKSIRYNGNLAMMNADYSFTKDIPNKVVLKLSGSVDKDKELLIQHLVKEIDLEWNKKWINDKINKWVINYETIFK